MAPSNIPLPRSTVPFGGPIDSDPTPVQYLSALARSDSEFPSVEPTPCRLRAFTLPKLRRAVLGVTQWKRLQYTVIIVF
jgi:hypothetical protein